MLKLTVLICKFFLCLQNLLKFVNLTQTVCMKQKDNLQGFNAEKWAFIKVLTP
jgi:hypothetical protein